MSEKRGNFSGGIGFVLAAAGSAVGLGNLWRFPYLAAQYGGGIFLLVYLILAVTFGFALLATEIAIGRKTKQSSITAYDQFHKGFSWMGYLGFLIPAMILPYYCVIGGWVVKYMLVFLSGQGKTAAADTYFSSYVGQTAQPLIFFVLFLVITALVIFGGVQKGIERASKFLMPILVIISILICIYVATIDGALDGIKYYLLPDVHKFSFKTICAAMGQLFFSMSIAMGIMVSYGSYVKDEVNLSKSVNQIEIFDTAIAFMAGFMIIPAVFVFSGEEGLKSGGPGLMFMTLPKVFGQMPGGQVIGALFFVLVFMAAVTSSISILETTVSMLMDKWKFSRVKSILVLGAFSLLMGIPSSLGFGIWSGFTVLKMDILSFFDFLTNSVLMPILAFGTCVLIGWVCKTDCIEEEITKNGESFGRRKLYRVMIKYVCPVCLVIIFFFYILAQFGVFTF